MMAKTLISFCNFQIKTNLFLMQLILITLPLSMVPNYPQ